MELIDFTTAWVKGEVFQGKIMLAIGFLFLFGGIAVFKSEHEILKGTLIPLGFILVIFFGYGGFQTYSRPNHISKVSNLMIKNPKAALTQEYEKAMKDDKAYSRLKIVWAILIVLSAGLYFVFAGFYFKGFSMGLIGLFITALIVDSLLHSRLLKYLDGMQELMK